MVKEWILNLAFVRTALSEAERQGGIKSFPLAQKDILDTMRDDLDKKAEELANNKLTSLLSVVDWKKVVTINEQQGILYIGGERADDMRLQNLKQEAEFIIGSELWQLIIETPKALAHKAMFTAGESLDDMKKGRAMLFTLTSQEKVVRLLKSYTGKPVDKTKNNL